MSKTLGIGITVLVAAVLLVGNIVSILNADNKIRVTVEAKQRDNMNELDGTIKTISQTAQVTDAQKTALKEIFIGHAEARTGDGGNNAIMKWIQESVPNVDTSTFNNLQNIITAKRDGFVMRQKELQDLWREHKTPYGYVWSGLILQTFGRKVTDITIVTSSRVQQAFETGVDDDDSVFKK